MINHLAILFFLCSLLISSCAYNNDQDTKVVIQKIDSNKILEQDSVIKIQAELIPNLDTIKNLRSCGYLCQVMLLNFKVTKVLKGKYDLSVIPIFILCPKEKIRHKTLQNNKIYTYLLKRTNKDKEFYCITASDNFGYYILDK